MLLFLEPKRGHILKPILSVMYLETSCSGGFVSLFSMIKIVTNICPREMNVKQALKF